MDFIEHLAGTLAGSPSALAAIAALLIIDGFFPFVPGESLVVAASAATAASGGSPWWLLAVAVPASLVGDLIAFTLGRRLDVVGGRWLRRPKVAAVFAYTRTRLERSPASILLTAKFLPVVRVVAPMTAGATRMRLRRYLPLTAVSVGSYTTFHVAVGAAAASWLPNPVIALVAAVAFAAVCGVAIDATLTAFARRRARRTTRASRAGAAAATDPEWRRPRPPLPARAASR